MLARTDFASGERGSPLQIIHYFYCIKSYVYKHINSSMRADNISPNGLWDYTKPLRDLHGLVLVGRYFWVQNLGSSVLHNK